MVWIVVVVVVMVCFVSLIVRWCVIHSVACLWLVWWFGFSLEVIGGLVVWFVVIMCFVRLIVGCCLVGCCFWAQFLCGHIRSVPTDFAARSIKHVGLMCFRSAPSPTKSSCEGCRIIEHPVHTVDA